MDRSDGSRHALAARCGSTLEIVLGRYQAKQRECRQCGAAWTAYEEKETDVNIAVSLVADAASGAADIALLVTAVIFATHYSRMS